MANPQSTMQIAGHPIHPMLIPFPVAFLVTAFVADLAYWATGNANWATAALWLIGAGVIMALVAAIAGFTDFMGEPRIRELNDAWLHFIGNLLAVAVSAFNWYWHLGGVAVGYRTLGDCCLYRKHVGIAEAADAGTSSTQQRRAA